VTKSSVQSGCAFGIYTYHIRDSKVFYSKLSGTRETYLVADLEGQLSNAIVGRIADTFGGSNVPFLDMAANQVALSGKVLEQLKPEFAELGLSLDTFVVENLSLPDELQKVRDQRIGMNMVGDMGRYTQFEVAQAIPIAAANEGGGAAGVGAGLGAGVAMGQAMIDALKKAGPATGEPGAAQVTGSSTTRSRDLPGHGAGAEAGMDSFRNEGPSNRSVN
jgi:membrane protease subunit (stomatin/prohibitin family)